MCIRDSYKRLPTTILSSFCSNVSCCEQQSWFSSTVSWLPCLSAPVSYRICPTCDHQIPEERNYITTNHHISIVFPPPPQPPHSHCFPSTRFYKRPPTAILSLFCSNVSCSEQQSWFSSTVSWLPCLAAPVSFKDSYSTTTTCTNPSLIQCTHGTHSYPRRK